jgi:hypothetical protein
MQRVFEVVKIRLSAEGLSMPTMSSNFNN